MAATGGAGSGGGAGGGLPAEYTLAFGDIEWEKDEDDERVELGRGASGIVYAGNLHGQPVAIKHETIDNTVDAAAWTRTVVLHMRANCPHIALMHGAVVRAPKAGSKSSHYSVMERLAGTMTERLLTRGGAHYDADMELRLALLADVAGGLEYLHSRDIIHGDVKPDNVLLTAVTPQSPFPSAKLVDFGSSVMWRVGSKTRESLMGERGTVLYMDPRLFDPTTCITTASDVHSFGVLAWQVLTGRVPFEAEMMETMMSTATVPQKVEALRRHVLGSGRPSVAALVERGVPSSVVALVESCWAPEAGSRPAMAEVQRVLVGAAGPAGADVPLVYEWNDPLVLRGHTNNVWSLALLPGGQLASGDQGGTVRLWDATRGGEATAVLEGHGGWVCALAALPDGYHLAAGVYAPKAGEVGAIVLWDTGVVPPTRCATIDCGSGVVALAVLRNGRLAAGCIDNGVRLVEVGADAGAVAATLKGHTSGVAALAVLPDGTLASGSWDKSVRLWEVGAQVCVATLPGHTSDVNALTVLTDDRLFSGSDDKSVRLWDVATRACAGVLQSHTKGVMALAALPDGRLASGSRDTTIRVWDTRPAAGADAAAEAGGGVAHATPVVVLEGHTDNVNASPAGRPTTRCACGACRPCSAVQPCRIGPFNWLLYSTVPATPRPCRVYRALRLSPSSTGLSATRLWHRGQRNTQNDRTGTHLPSPYTIIHKCSNAHLCSLHPIPVESSLPPHPAPYLRRGGCGRGSQPVAHHDATAGDGNKRLHRCLTRPLYSAPCRQRVAESKRR